MLGRAPEKSVRKVDWEFLACGALFIEGSQKKERESVCGMTVIAQDQRKTIHKRLHRRPVEEALQAKRAWADVGCKDWL